MYNTGLTFGVAFTPTADLHLTALGFWDYGSDGLPAPFQVGLWDDSTGTLLASVTISSEDALDTSLTVEGGQWRYESLGASVNLASGTTYMMGYHSSTIVSADENLILNFSTVSGDPLVTLTGEFHIAIGGALAFPGIAIPTSGDYPGLVNAQFNVAAVPEPGCAVLVALGAIGLLRRRRGM